MIMDAELRFSNAQDVTAAANSSNLVDMGSVRNIGEGKPLFLVSVVTTAFTDAGSNSTITVSLEGDTTSTITPDATEAVLSIPALAAAGDTFIAPLRPGADVLGYRFLRVSYAPVNGNLSTGNVTTFLTQDAAKYRAYAKNYTIS